MLMKKSRKKKITGRTLTVIITASLFAVFLLAVFITDFFIPIRYFTAYCVQRDNSRPQGMEVTFLDVGFGDCAFVSFPDGKTMLVDGANGDYSNNLKILKFLNARGVNEIDYLVCTSVKEEHCAGLAEIAKYKKLGKAFIPYSKNKRVTDGYFAFTAELEKLSAAYSYASVGEGVFEEDYGYFMTFLSPTNYLSPSSEYTALNTKANAENIDNASAVIWLEYQDCAIIFTSDARPEALKRIIADYEITLAVGDPYCAYKGKSVQLNKCAVVTAPAHAGAKNTCAEWYGYLKPEQAIISVGRNFSDYPSIEAISDIQNFCKPLYTEYSGNVTVRIDGGLTVSVQKSED